MTPRRRSTRASISQKLRDPLNFNNPHEAKKNPLTGALVLPASMASLIFAAGFLTYNKVKDQKEKRREKKRKVHEEWFEDLQREHSRGVEEKTGHGKVQSQSQESEKGRVAAGGNNPFEDKDKDGQGRRGSSESQRSQDGPDQWVDHVVRSKSLGTAA